MLHCLYGCLSPRQPPFPTHPRSPKHLASITDVTCRFWDADYISNFIFFFFLENLIKVFYREITFSCSFSFFLILYAQNSKEAETSRSLEWAEMVADKVFSGLFTVCRDTFVCYIQWVNTSSPCAQGFGEPLGRGRSYANSWSSWNRTGRFGAHKVPQKPILMT